MYREDPDNVLLDELAKVGQVKDVEIEIAVVEGEELQPDEIVRALYDHGHVVVRVGTSEAVGARPHQVHIHHSMRIRQCFLKQPLNKG